jgi:aldose 1-epimerase
MARVQLLALLCLAASLSLGAPATTGPDARVGVYELKLGDFSVKVTNWGARLMSVVLPDSKGSSGQSSLSIFLLSPLHMP